MAVLSQPVNINGVAFAHGDIVVNILGVPVLGITDITYDDPQDIESNYGTGHKPISVGFGKITYTGTITIEMGDVEALMKVAPFNRIQNIPFFDIGVNFITEAGQLARHSLKQCRFKGRSVTSAVDNTQLTEAIELHISDIDYNAV